MIVLEAKLPIALAISLVICPLLMELRRNEAEVGELTFAPCLVEDSAANPLIPTYFAIVEVAMGAASYGRWDVEEAPAGV